MWLEAIILFHLEIATQPVQIITFTSFFYFLRLTFLLIFQCFMPCSVHFLIIQVTLHNLGLSVQQHAINIIRFLFLGNILNVKIIFFTLCFVMLIKNTIETLDSIFKNHNFGKYYDINLWCKNTWFRHQKPQFTCCTIISSFLLLLISSCFFCLKRTIW